MSLQTQTSDAKGISAATRKAKGKLRRKNKHRCKWGLTVPGDLTLTSGSTIRLNDAGVFSDVYYIDEARHTGSPAGGFITELDIHRILKPFTVSATTNPGN